jgi:AraC-like DNA-binding protein
MAAMIERRLVDATLGCSDQSHLCRVVRSQTGYTPSALRRALV